MTIKPMPQFAANITMLFNEVPFPERPAATAVAGFRAVEYLFPYDYSPAELAAWNKSAQLQQALINMPAGDWSNGERGLACLPDRREEFMADVDQAIVYAKALECPLVHLVAGLCGPDGPLPEQVACYIENIKEAADRLAVHNLGGCIETLNCRDVPGFFLTTSGQALDLLDKIDRPNSGFQFDFYHVQIMEGDVVRRFWNMADRIAHVQISNPPDRHEPHLGELNNPFTFEARDAAGYDDWVGCEYIPVGDTHAGLVWGADYGLNAD